MAKKPRSSSSKRTKTAARKNVQLEALSLVTGSPVLGRPTLVQTPPPEPNIAAQVLEGQHRLLAVPGNHDLPPISAQADQLIPPFTVGFPGVVKVTKRKRTRTILVRDKRTFLLQSNALITALQEALEYDSLRQHNQRPPELRTELHLDAPDTAAAVRELVEELKKLNGLLAVSNRIPKQETIHITKHLNTFIGQFAKWSGRGTAGLAVASAGTLLIHLGVDLTAIPSLAGLK